MSKINDGARRVYGLLAPPVSADPFTGSRRGDAWVALALALAWFGIQVWVTWQAISAALGTPLVPLAMLLCGVAVLTGLMALAFIAVAVVVVLSGALRSNR